MTGVPSEVVADMTLPDLQRRVLTAIRRYQWYWTEDGNYLEVAGKKVLVIGAARSGIASAKFLIARGATVALNDAKPVEKWNADALCAKERRSGLPRGELPGWLLDQLDLVVISPGVPTKAIPLRYAERAGAEVIGEVELASRYLKGRIVAITGSNGKTTTTSLIGELLRTRASDAGRGKHRHATHFDG